MSKILLVEDAQLWQHTLSKILQDDGYEVAVTDSYETAEPYLTAESGPTFDLILLDLALDEWSNNLQGMDLLPLIDASNQRHRVKTIIFVDQDTHDGTRTAARNALFEYKDTVFKSFDKSKFGNGQEFLKIVQQALRVTEVKEDWGEVVDVSVFYGRKQELATLEKWLVVDQCRLVTILGFGGMGKSSIVRKLVEQINDQLDYIFWRDLRNGPLFEDVLSDCIGFLSDQQRTDLPEDTDEKISLLLEYLQRHRCLIVLDNLETILQKDEYREGYENYGTLIHKMGTTEHQSCLMLTSREKPPELLLLEEDKNSPARLFQLTGLKPAEGQAILQDKGLFGTDETWKILIDRYRGNPLALKLVADTIQEVFSSDIASFLDQEDSTFGDMLDLLEPQFNRLPEQEQAVMYWLAVGREAVSVDELIEDMVPITTEAEVLNVIKSLQYRSVIEAGRANHFILQPVILEYVTDRLVSQVFEEIKTKEIKLFISHALMKAQAKDYVRESQIRFILKPLLDRLTTFWGNHSDLETQLRQILATLPEKEKEGYAAGNVLNMLGQLRNEVREYDFSHLTIRQAYLQQLKLYDVNFAYAEFVKSVFLDTFGGVLSVAFSPDSKLLAAGTIDGDVRILNVAEGRKFLTCIGHTNWVKGLAFSPDGNLLASSGDDETVRLWEVNTGKCLRTLAEHTNWVYSVAFSPDGYMLASGSDDYTVKLWDPNTGQCLKTLREHTGDVRSVAFHPNGQIIVSGSGDKTVKFWDVNSGKCLMTLPGQVGWISAIAFNSDGSILAIGGEDHSLKLWSINTNNNIYERLKTLQGHTAPIRSIVFSSDDFTIASSSDDMTIRLWDIEKDQSIKTLQGHTSRIRSVALSPDDNVLASGSDDQTIRLWDSNTGHCLRNLQGYDGTTMSIAFSSDNRTLVSGGEDRTIKLWDVQTGECLRILQGHSNAVWSVAFSSDGHLAASGSQDRTVRLWDTHTGACLKILRGHHNRVWSVAFSPNDDFVASGSDDQTVRIWDVRTGQCHKIFTVSANWVWAVSFNSEGDRVASGGDDHTVQLWDIKTEQCLKTLQGHHRDVRSIAFSPNGRMVASGSEDCTTKLWDVNTGQCLKTLQGHTAWVRTIAFSPDGHMLVTGSEDHTVKFWDIDTGQCLRTLAAHELRVTSVALSPDGHTLASASSDETIKIWDAAAGEYLRGLNTIRPYEGTNISGVKGLTEVEKTSLEQLGAIEDLL